ncbi:MAG: hypothetical protein CM15mP74_25920 [Halieaceae bacterium]|nr:MAG: hypothetical protein CM15mP74_25920 [Halieaceae bacterium]
MVECSSERHIRGIAQGDLASEAATPLTLLAGGQLVLTVERDAGQRYQGIIALEHASLLRPWSSTFLRASNSAPASGWLRRRAGGGVDAAATP